MQRFAAFIVLSLSLSAMAMAAPEPATMVFTDGNVLTMNATRAVVQSVAIRGNQIVAVERLGERQHVRPQARA